MNKYGLTNRDMQYIINSVKSIPEVEKVVLIGSRAMGNFKAGSDIDLVCYGDHVYHAITRKLSHQLNEELPLPYFVDVLSFRNIENQELKTHVLQFGIEIYNSSHQENARK